ncbi:MAG TPA: CHAT domain-containing protein [Roseiflexaceae bacterium]
MKAYLDFEIQISALDAGRYVLSVSGPGGDARHTITLPLGDPTYEELAARLGRFDTDEAGLVELGQILFRALFQGPIKDVYTRSQSAIKPEQGLRLRFNIDLETDARVAALPWEFLCDPDHGPLAMLGAPIVRYLPQQAVIPSLTTVLPLRVLLTGAQTPPPADIDRELREVEATLAEMGEHVQIAVEPHLTTSKLRARLREGFHIWHFIGHGGFSRDGATGLLKFEDSTGDAADVTARELGIMLQGSGLRLVVLSACNSATLVIDPLRSVAPALVRAQIPAVVAMQFSVPQDAARAFAGEFYRTLAEGWPIDACVTEGRKAVMDVARLRRPDWGIPVVYTRAPDGKLFELPAPPTAQPPQPEEVRSSLDPGFGRSAGVGLNALQTLIRAEPSVHDAAIAFRSDFQVACEQIDLLGDYKDIHDQLHSLQFHCYNPIVQETKRAADADLAWEALVDYELTFQEIVSRLQDIAGQAPQELTMSQDDGAVSVAPGIGRTALAPNETAWIQDLVQSHQELQGAIENADAKQLKRAIRLMNRVLTVQPTQVNTRLNSTARTLRLSSLVQALARVRDVLALPELDSEKVRQFEVGAASLSALSVGLSTLVDDHDRWQAIDLELRRIEATLDQDIGELELSWLDLKALIAPLCATAEPWAAAILADGEKLESAIDAQDAARIKQFFRRYRRQVGDRFYRVDVDLKRTCDDLRKIVAPLASVLRIIA